VQDRRSGPAWWLPFEELPLDVVRVPEGDHRRTHRVSLHPTVGHASGIQDLDQASNLTDGDADGEVVQTDTVLAEPIA
jgi:hypothetical protein